MGEASEKAKAARIAAQALSQTTSTQRNAALNMMADALVARAPEILAANERDMDAARAKGTPAPLLDRLLLTPERIDGIASGLRQVAMQPEVLGEVLEGSELYNGLRMIKYRVPLGVIAMIYEARPNVTVDAAILCVKAGNAVILRGGSEAVRSNRALAEVLRQGLSDAGLPEDAVQLVPGTDRAAVTALCKLDSCIDVIIPRGGEGLVRAVSEAATMPVLKHDKGVCHLYVDAGADLQMALDLVENGKTQRPGVCNALECLLVHRHEAAAFLPLLAARLGPAGVEFRADPASLPLLGPAARPQAPEDLGHEFHDLVLAVRVVDDMDAALAHIAAYGSNHSEVICTRDYGRARRFLREADASMVAVNASTRFNDGGQLGLGAEIGISTSKLHAYGPMGVGELTTTKFVVLGNGQIRQ